jgi:hypothetical protein
MERGIVRYLDAGIGLYVMLYKRTSFVGVSAQCPATTEREF